jgi:hypothetical protein
MPEQLMSLVSLAVLLVPLAVLVRQFLCVRRGQRTRRAALLRCAVFSVLPAVIYVGVFLALVGVEELAGVALIGDGYARALPLVVVAGLGLTLAGTLVLAVAMMFMRRSPG